VPRRGSRVILKCRHKYYNVVLWITIQFSDQNCIGELLTINKYLPFTRLKVTDESSCSDACKQEHEKSESISCELLTTKKA
jgi:hypothetical protein